jgi:hypothetical protein
MSTESQIVAQTGLFVCFLVSCVSVSLGDLESGKEKGLKVDAQSAIAYPRDEAFRISGDRVVQGDKYSVVLSQGEMESNYHGRKNRWRLKADLSSFPAFKAPEFPLLQALYNMALEEALLDILPEKSFMAGKEWTGIWTRDISYSIHLSLGLLLPEIAGNSLKAKVGPTMQIIQDTGTGGSWPVSTDRAVWALAAREVYLVTGDLRFLQYAYQVLRNTAEADRRNARDGSTGLYAGESSFMDWREQSYPLWMQPVDIFESRSISTCVLHSRLNSILYEMAILLKKDRAESDVWKQNAEGIKAAINHDLWLADKQYYSSYRYPAIMGGMLSDKSDTLGEALAVLFDIAGEQKAGKLVETIPVVPFGAPCMYPQQPHARPYHSKAVWPFVNAYYAWAGAKVHNEAAVVHGVRSIIRAAALFLTNKENFSSDRGHSGDTEINSDRQLWSVAGYLSVVYRILFGMELCPEGLRFRPMVPGFIKGPLVLENFKYRGSTLTIRITGHGASIKSCRYDGGSAHDLVITPDTTGEHRIDIEMEPAGPDGKINLQSSGVIAPLEPRATLVLDKAGSVGLSWTGVNDAVAYAVYKNGRLLTETSGTNLTDTLAPGDAMNAGVYSVQAVDSNRVPSNLSAYLLAVPDGARTVYEAEAALGDMRNIQAGKKGFSGNGYYRTTAETNDVLSFRVLAMSDGEYLIRFKYANGHGLVYTDNKCCIRSLSVDHGEPATVVMPQRTSWADWGYSSGVTVPLTKGSHTVKLFYAPANANMNQLVNEAYVDFMELIRMNGKK